MGLLVMILGLVLFLGVHTLTTQRELRARLIASTGEGSYKIGYALASAAGHLLANGDLGSILLFGSFLGWAVFDRISLKHRTDTGAPPIPVGGPGNDLIAVAVGLVAYLALAFAFHPVVIGVPVVGA